MRIDRGLDRVTKRARHLGGEERRLVGLPLRLEQWLHLVQGGIKG